MKGWPAALQGRETGARPIAAPALRPNGGVLVLEAEVRGGAVALGKVTGVAVRKCGERQPLLLGSHKHLHCPPPQARHDAIPGGILGALGDSEQPIHYGGVQAPSLAAFGEPSSTGCGSAPQAFWLPSFGDWLGA